MSKASIAFFAKSRRGVTRAASRLARTLRAGPRHVRHRWSRLSHLQQHWIWNIAIGLAIEAGLGLAAGTHFVVSAENWAMDSTQRRLSSLTEIGQILAGGARDGTAPFITVIDADEETWRSPDWGSGPYRAPRGPLGSLVASALAAGAQYVVLDVAMDTPTPSRGAEASYAEEMKGDGDLAAALTSLQPILTQRKGAIILVRGLREPLFAKDQLAPVLPPSPLDTLTQNHPDQFINAAPYFVTDRDGVLRSWRLWRGACAPGAPTRGAPAWQGRWAVLPSVQLAIKTLITKSDGAPWSVRAAHGSCLLSPDGLGGGVSRADAKNGEAKLDRSVLGWLKAHPSVTGRPFEASGEGVESGDRNAFNPLSRIYYSAAYPSHFDAIQTVSALNVLRAWPGATFGSDPRLPMHVGQVAIIGQSSDAVGDVHATPLGSMPGVMVLANAVQSMRDRGIVQPAPEIVKLPITLATIIVIGLAFARFDSVRGSLVIGVVFYAFLVVANYLLFLTNYWFDFAVPLIGLYADRLFSAFEEHVRLRTITASVATHAPTAGGSD